MNAGKPIDKHSAQQALRLKWIPDQSVSYGVCITFENEGSKNEVKYEVKVSRLKPGSNNEPLFQIERTSEVFVNEAIPELVADRLAYEAGKVFYPLVISVDNNGGFETVYNHDEILKRWPKIKSKLLSNFDGVMTDYYIANMEKLLAIPLNVTNILGKNDWLINTFFKPIYKVYQKDKFEKMVFPILNNSNVDNYLIAEKFEKNSNSFGAIEVHHEGSIEMENADNFNQYFGDYQGKYFLHPKYKYIISLISDFSISCYATSKVHLRVFMIPEDGRDFDYDFLSTYDENNTITSGAVILDGPPQKSFWERLLNI
ncbi:hypothetical protein [Pedobacter sp. GR22-10]|uniref:hypothetical protein n=1 Tax=Pedobacter sp. GR22-10 TaxID=2994472 RepID=UPI002246FFBD|nr:hypothetical protein [Pedobacter sp. GR22-10]MCX2433393.1 hypothetical protein [Pedobacter sp. GR22-10]